MPSRTRNVSRPTVVTLMVMRLGLLVCDHVAPRFTGIAGDYPDMFEAMFAAHPEVDLVHYDLTANSYPVGARDCDAWITTGSRLSVNDTEPWIEWLADFVPELARTEVPFLGVCFGHQMLARALGGRVDRSNRGWGIGVKTVDISNPPPDWLGLSDYRVLNSHQDQIADLPPGAAVIGSNSHCPVSMVTVGESLMGLQGHPEFPAAYARALIEDRRGGLIPEHVADAGLASLETQPDNAALAAALVRFVSQR